MSVLSNTITIARTFHQIIGNSEIKSVGLWMVHVQITLPKLRLEVRVPL